MLLAMVSHSQTWFSGRSDALVAFEDGNLFVGVLCSIHPDPSGSAFCKNPFCLWLWLDLHSPNSRVWFGLVWDVWPLWLESITGWEGLKAIVFRSVRHLQNTRSLAAEAEPSA